MNCSLSYQSASTSRRHFFAPHHFPFSASSLTNYLYFCSFLSDLLIFFNAIYHTDRSSTFYDLSRPCCCCFFQAYCNFVQQLWCENNSVRIFLMIQFNSSLKAKYKTTKIKRRTTQHNMMQCDPIGRITAGHSINWYDTLWPSVFCAHKTLQANLY